MESFAGLKNIREIVISGIPSAQADALEAQIQLRYDLPGMYPRLENYAGIFEQCRSLLDAANLDVRADNVLAFRIRRS